jgi:acyl carrier protein
MYSEQIRHQIAQTLQLPLESVTNQEKLSNLLTDSIALIEAMIDLQELFGIQLVHENMRGILTVEDLLKLIVCKLGGPSEIDFSDPSLLAMYEIALKEDDSFQDAA